MDNEISIVALSKDSKYAVFQKGDKYSLSEVGSTEDAMKWKGFGVLASALMKSGFILQNEEESNIQKSRKSVVRVDEDKKKKKQSLIVSLGLEEVRPLLKSDIVQRVGFVGYSVMEFDRDSAETTIQHIFDDLNPADVIVIGATKLGVPSMVVSEAKKRKMTTVGIIPNEATEDELSDVDHMIVYGEYFGDESQVFIDMLDCLYYIGGGAQSIKEVNLAMEKGIPVYEYLLAQATDYNTINKAGTVHIPKGAERHSYEPTSEYGVIYIPVNRLRRIYQTADASNKDKVSQLVTAMKSGKKLDPVQVGYNYDVHDGHHRWDASIKAGYTHVPCQIIGNDKDKLAEAKMKYRSVWKSDELVIDLEKSGIHVLHKGKLVKKLVPIKGKGKTFYAYRWVDPSAKMPEGTKNARSDESTYKHHTEGVKERERRFSNKFPVVHQETNKVKNKTPFYRTTKEKMDQARQDYHEGKELPPIVMNERNEILENHHLLDLAKELKLSHIPAIVMGNPGLKSALEKELRGPSFVEEEDESGVPVLKPLNPPKKDNDGIADELDPDMDLPTIKGYEHITNVDQFTNIVARKYPKQYIMEAAEEDGIRWDKYTNDGDRLPDNSPILWMNAHQAISSAIRRGKPLRIKYSKDKMREKSQEGKKDSLHMYLLEVMQKFNGNRDAVMEYCGKTGITYKQNHDPYKTWMNCCEALKRKLAEGTMIMGVRVREKAILEDGQAVITDQIRQAVSSYGKKYGKSQVMFRMENLGISYVTTNKKGMPIEDENMLWMRAATALQLWMAKGNVFTISETEKAMNEANKGLKATVGDKTQMSRFQKMALDLAARNTQDVEEGHKKWAKQALFIDQGNFTDKDAEEHYSKMMENARNADLMVHFDPMEMTPNGTTLAEQLISSGKMGSDFDYGRSLDIDEDDPEFSTWGRYVDDRNLYGDDYDEAKNSERPIYGNIDLYKQGLASNANAGSVALVMKKDVHSRSTASSVPAGQHQYGDEGKKVRSLADPHHLMIDRWTSRWKKIGNRDPQRARAMESIMYNKSYGDDKSYFEAHIHGGIDLKNDVDHILVPSSWKSDSKHKNAHKKLVEMSKLHSIPIKYEEER